MFDNLSEKLSGILDRLTRRGALTAADVDAALREVRRALLEADVALDVVKSFVDKVRERAVGVEVVRSVTPGRPANGRRTPHPSCRLGGRMFNLATILRESASKSPDKPVTILDGNPMSYAELDEASGRARTTSSATTSRR